MHYHGLWIEICAIPSHTVEMIIFFGTTAGKNQGHIEILRRIQGTEWERLNEKEQKDEHRTLLGYTRH